MKNLASLTVVVALMFGAATRAVQAEEWHALAGGQTFEQVREEGKQSWAFLPNELWVHAGDSVKWTSPGSFFHTVSFLSTIPREQIRPPAQTGCPGATPQQGLRPMGPSSMALLA